MNKHLHRYHRMKLGKDYLVYKCQLPGCSHYVPVKLAVGRICECNRCRNPMSITKASAKLAKPHCVDCTNWGNKDVDKIADRLSKLGM